MGSGKRKKKTARKQAANIPTWLTDKNVSVQLKREVEDALARHAADNGLVVGSAKFRNLTLQDICASLKLVHARWRAVEPRMLKAGAQPVTKVLTTYLQACKKKRAMMEQMVADLKAAAGDGSQSSQGSAEEGEGEEEEAQADGSDGEPADPRPAYAEGNPRELLQPRSWGAHGSRAQKAEGEEGAAGVVSQEAEQMVEQIVGGIVESIRAQKAAEGTAEHENQPPGASRIKLLRVTAEDVRRWAEVGERCKRIKFYWDELEKEEAAI